MKKAAIILVILFATATITSCKSTKGCGLTGDANTPNTNPIVNISEVNSEIV